MSALATGECHSWRLPEALGVAAREPMLEQAPEAQVVRKRVPVKEDDETR